jgi:hypothetical protein
MAAKSKLITDEIVTKAVVARGSDASSEGIGKVTQRMLEAVADDIVDRWFLREYGGSTGPTCTTKRKGV